MIFGSGIDWLGVAAMPLLTAGLLVFSALLVVALIRTPTDSPEQSGVHLRTPRETLDEHLAKGEITRDEYVERREALDFKAIIV
jgi:uncharacterized membrane protein